jgi:hemerythrin-like domain-containing protein
MTGTTNDPTEGLHLYDELIAVHTILRRGAGLVADAMGALAEGRAVDVRTLVAVARWHSTFLHHHHASEDELFWPLLRRLFPERDEDLTRLTAEHVDLDRDLQALALVIDQLDTAEGRQPAKARELAAWTGHKAATRAHEGLVSHLDDEEPVMRELFPGTPATDIVALRKAIVAAAPKSGPDLVLGLLVDPDPAPGYDLIAANFPPPVRWMRPLLLRRYRSRRAALTV